MINARGSVLLCLFAAAFVLAASCSRNVPVVACGGEIDATDSHKWRAWNFEHVALDAKGDALK